MLNKHEVEVFCNQGENLTAKDGGKQLKEYYKKGVDILWEIINDNIVSSEVKNNFFYAVLFLPGPMWAKVGLSYGFFSCDNFKTLKEEKKQAKFIETYTKFYKDKFLG